MEGASQIKIGLDLGTHNLSIAATQINVSLTSIVIFAAKILSLINTENRKIPNVVSNDLDVQHYNTDLTWEEGYNRLENLQMIQEYQNQNYS